MEEIDGLKHEIKALQNENERLSQGGYQARKTGVLEKWRGKPSPKAGHALSQCKSMSVPSDLFQTTSDRTKEEKGKGMEETSSRYAEAASLQEGWRNPC